MSPCDEMNADRQGRQGRGKPVPVILDTDIGGDIDDTWALGMLLNCPELVGVQILFSGEEVSTLTGHLDLSRPLRLNKRLIAS